MTKDIDSMNWEYSKDSPQTKCRHDFGCTNLNFWCSFQGHHDSRTNVHLTQAHTSRQYSCKIATFVCSGWSDLVTGYAVRKSIFREKIFPWRRVFLLFYYVLSLLFFSRTDARTARLTSQWNNDKYSLYESRDSQHCSVIIVIVAISSQRYFSVNRGCIIGTMAQLFSTEYILLTANRLVNYSVTCWTTIRCTR